MRPQLVLCGSKVIRTDDLLIESPGTIEITFLRGGATGPQQRQRHRQGDPQRPELRLLHSIQLPSGYSPSRPLWAGKSGVNRAARGSGCVERITRRNEPLTSQVPIRQTIVGVRREG